MAAVGPLSVDLYLPAFPDLVASLETSESMVQITLAAPTVELLAVARLGQGLAASVGVVIAQGIVRDLYDGALVARMLSRLMLVIGVVPVLAPVLGGQPVEPMGWRGRFWLLTGIGVGLTILAWRAAPETHLARQRRPRNDGGVYRRLLSDRRFVVVLIIATLAYVAILVYVAGAPFAYSARGVGAGAFSLLFGLNAVGLTACSQLNARFVMSHPLLRLLAHGALLATFAGVLTLIACATGVAGLIGLAVPLLVLVSATGFVLPHAMALVLERHPDHAGAAAALVGCIQFLVSAAAAPLSGIAGSSTGIPMAATVTTATAAIAVLTLTLRTNSHHSRRPRATPAEML